jgi:prevent-host-death family protein
MEVNVLEAKTQLSKLIERALQGEDVVVARNGVPAVRLVPVTVEKRRLGLGEATSAPLAADFSERCTAPLNADDLSAWS